MVGKNEQLCYNLDMSGTLYLVATPIGNLDDLTLRAMKILQEADVVVCEDTRVTHKLLLHLGLKKPAISLHEHADEKAYDAVLDRLFHAQQVAYVCDAGTPGMNDPGGKLVERAFLHGIKVVPIPGASSLTAGISVCGFPMDEFTYLGFVPHKKGRETFFRQLAERDEAVIFLESTHRIEKTMEQLQGAVGNERLLFVGRELTKMHETLYRGTIDAIQKALQSTSTKGEYILILAPNAFRGLTSYVE